MGYKKNNTHSFFASVVVMVAARIFSCIKGSFVFGSRTAFFSLSSVFAPLSGFYGGVAGSFFNSILAGSLVLMRGVSLPLVMFLYLPTLGASLYWSLRTRWYRIGVPLACAVLFLLHPEGRSAYLYVAYWLIPIVIAVFNPASFFLHALACTFMAHALGSVIWLYVYSIPATVWLHLMPLVIVERLLFALGMTTVYYAVIRVENLLNTVLYNKGKQQWCSILRVSWTVIGALPYGMGGSHGLGIKKE